MDANWKDLIAAAIVTLPAIVAAISSLRNGRRLNGGMMRHSVLCPKCYHVFVHPHDKGSPSFGVKKKFTAAE